MRRYLWGLILTVLTGGGIYLALICSPKPPLLQDLSFSKAVYDDHHKLLRLSLTADQKYRLYTPLSSISKNLIATTLSQEDQYFYRHPGFNPIAMIRAFWQTYILKTRRMGASTISMQVARLKFNMVSKRPLGKLYQLIKAVQLETHYSKDQILEAYLNLAPYGGNIEGIGAASLIYFHQPATTLSLPQAVSLSLIPQNPNKRGDPDAVHRLPFLAPHLVTTVLSHRPTDQQQIVTTVDLSLQQIFEKTLSQYLERQQRFNVNNAAVLLVDTRTMAAKVVIGSASFNNQQIDGQINGTLIKRSPGSTLKPFIYALAFDQGLIHPDSLLKDLPHPFGGYDPDNFDHAFMGPIKAKDALILSRNIPAISLLEKLKTETLFTLLQQAGVTGLKSPDYYGLSLGLGTAEVSLTELVSLYAMLTNQGVWRPIRFTQDTPMTGQKPLLSPEASFLTVDILRQSPKPYFLDDYPLAYKTGTSSGYRDAWTVGLVGPYALGVWLGNFNNQANPTLIGQRLAAPLFFSLINALNQDKVDLRPVDQPISQLHLKKIEVCQVSGLLPTKNCPSRNWTWFIPGKSPIQRDKIHQAVAIDAKTGLRACHINQNTTIRVYEFWPSDLMAAFRRAGIHKKLPPPYAKDCPTQRQWGLPPKIQSPEASATYFIDPIRKTRIPFVAITDGEVKTVYWFLNEAFVGQAKAGEPFLWQARPGTFMLRLVDDQGLSTVRKIRIKEVPVVIPAFAGMTTNAGMTTDDKT